ncbi:TRAP transporter small permease subunit [Aurantimonas sp. A2-1-M11]|uniref:TRAP transporter small permease n=1 Tax=Aurantimonas sp. A2-1-M11 TaxID=3113712 RepID=UPI002F95196A
MSRLARWLDVSLQAVTIFLLVCLALVVLLGVAYRYSGNSLIWYDEVASVLLAWITFTGAALATMRNAHLSFSGLLYSLPPTGRLLLFALVELIFLTVFAVIGWAGWAILDIFGNETLISVRFVSRSFVQAILPVSAGLIILGRLLTLAERYADAKEGLDPEDREIAAEIARAQAELDARNGGESR